MEFLKEEDIEVVIKQGEYMKKYYTGRWDDYIKEMVDTIKNIKHVKKTLEIGPFRTPIVVGGDVMDIVDENIKFYPIQIGKYIHHDASKVPYPIEDNAYDLIIASQVLEHLGYHGEQRQIFKEFKRISKKAIISLPYKNIAPMARDHHMIDEEVIDWWFDNQIPTFKEVNGSGNTRRILLLYEFE